MHCINLFVFLSLPCSGVVGDGEEKEVADLGLALGVAVAVGVAKRHHEFWNQKQKFKCQIEVKQLVISCIW